MPGGAQAILIGSERGFGDVERNQLAALPFVTRISLAPRSMGADIAAVAAMALWQSVIEDW